MSKAEGSVIIQKPINQVFQFVINSENNARWRTSFIESQRDPKTPVGQGMIVHQSMVGPGGRKFPGDYEVTEYVPDQSFSFKVIAGPARPAGKYTFESVAGGTKVTFSLWWEPKGLMQKLFMAPMVSKQIPKEVALLQNLKQALEGAK